MAIIAIKPITITLYSKTEKNKEETMQCLHINSNSPNIKTTKLQCLWMLSILWLKYSSSWFVLLVLLGKFKIYTPEPTGELWMICRPHTQFLMALVSSSLQSWVFVLWKVQRSETGEQELSKWQEQQDFHKKPEDYKNYTCAILEFCSSIENNGKHRYCI